MRRLLGAIFAWMKDGISLDETKVSLLMGSYAVFVVIAALYLVHRHSDIPNNLYNLMTTLTIILGTVTGLDKIGGSDGIINTVVDAVKNKISNI